MKRIIPNKLDGKRQAAIIDPLLSGLIAFRLGRAESEQYHNIAGAITIAQHVAEIVHRHNHLQEDLDKAGMALNSIFRRKEQRTIKDAPWSATPEEIEAIELGIEIYKGLIRTTPGPKFMQAVRKAMSSTVGIVPN